MMALVGMMVRQLSAVLALGAGLAALVSGQTVNRIPQPEGVFYYQPAASVFGSEAVWINPAGLGRFNSTSLQIMGDYFDGSLARSWGFVSQADRVSTAFRYLDNQFGGNFREWVFAGGMPMGNMLNVGASYRYFSDGPGYYLRMHNWTVGLQGNTRGVLSWGAVIGNLNRAKVAGERTETELRYSLAYRPSGGKITVAADAFLSTKTSFNNADFVYHLEATPTPGLFINGFIDSDRNWQVGLRVNLLHKFAGFKSRVSRGGDGRGTTMFLGTTRLSQPSIVKAKPARLTVSLHGLLPENPPRPRFGSSGSPYATLITNLHRAADDPAVGELAVSIGSLQSGFAKAQELREALAGARRQGKRVICHVEQPSNLSYYLASVSDSILIPPVSQLNLVGLRAELTFLAGTLDKLGVKVDMVRIGAYKSAAEQLTNRSATEENREQVNRLLDGMYEQLVLGIAEGRGLTPDSVRALIDQGLLTSVDAVACGLVDGTCYRDEFPTKAQGNERQVSFSTYITDTLLRDDWRPAPVLAVIVADGEITSDNGDISPFGRAGGVTPSPMERAFQQAAGDPLVKGIVFRIDSPGGSALASDAIWRSVSKAAAQKPVVVSMGNVAASGGFYIATPAVRLFADEGTVTGSIGIFGGKPDLSGLYQKIAMGKELYTRGKFAGMLTTIRPFTPEERAKLYSQIEAFYGHFVELVATSRGLTADSVDQLGQGRVWNGREALGAGLIDELGGLQESLEYLDTKLRLRGEYRIAVFPQRRPLVILPAAPMLRAAIDLLRSDRPTELLAETLALPREAMLYARLPFDLTIE